MAKKFDCDECRRLGKDKLRNCDGSHEDRLVLVEPSLPFMALKTCPIQLITADVTELWDHYDSFKLFGCLPYDGGYLDQPNIIIEAIKFCEHLVNKITNHEAYVKFTKKSSGNGKDSNNTSNLGQLQENRRRMKGIK